MAPVPIPPIHDNWNFFLNDLFFQISNAREILDFTLGDQASLRRGSALVLLRLPRCIRIARRVPLHSFLFHSTPVPSVMKPAHKTLVFVFELSVEARIGDGKTQLSHGYFTSSVSTCFGATLSALYKYLLTRP
mgnify:CR=1 FL=1